MTTGPHDWQPVPGAAHETLACANGCGADYDVWLAGYELPAGPCWRATTIRTAIERNEPS